jgi:hypothetical protein
MVTALVDRLGQTIPICFARQILDQANAAFQRGDLTTAGCKLREAARRLLEAQCKYHDCLPRKRDCRSPRFLLSALRKAGHCPDGAFRWLSDIIDVGNKAAHCQYVRPSLVECSITILYSLLDSATGYRDFKREGGAL